MKKIALLAIVSLFVFTTKNYAQCIGGFTPSGQECGGASRTAVPFLRINPDARSGAMGDVGVAISPDANAMHFNASKLAFADKDFGASVTYTPWLRSIGVSDINLLYLTGFKRFGNEVKQSVGLGIRFFSLGTLDWTDFNGSPLGSGSPRELDISVAYARQLSKNLSVGATGKFIYSNLATGLSPDGGGAPISSGIAGAVDFSMTYKKPIKVAAGESNLTLGASITNIGNKMTYSRSADFLPTNLGIGGAYELPFDKFNTIVFALDFNKFLTPTPSFKNNEWKEASTISGIFKSFGDAPGGFSEELQEITYSLGAEYWYDKQFAVRAGYFYENVSKGGRQYATVGLGLKYSIVSINMSYLVPTSSNRGPLDNTLRFSLLFDAASFQDAEE